MSSIDSFDSPSVFDAEPVIFSKGPLYWTGNLSYSFGFLCGIIALIVGIISWKSKAGKTAVIVVLCSWILAPLLWSLSFKLF